MQYRNADRPLDYTPLQRTPSMAGPWRFWLDLIGGCAAMLVIVVVLVSW